MYALFQLSKRKTHHFSRRRVVNLVLRSCHHSRSGIFDIGNKVNTPTKKPCAPVVSGEFYRIFIFIFFFCLFAFALPKVLHDGGTESERKGRNGKSEMKSERKSTTGWRNAGARKFIIWTTIIIRFMEIYASR